MEKPEQQDAQTFLEAIKAGQQDAFRELYVRHRAAFFRWAGRRFDAPKADFEDAWQEAVTAFFEAVVSGKLTQLRHDARTWLFAIGYRRLLNYKRKTKRIIWRDSIDDALQKESDFQNIDLEEPAAEKKEQLAAAMKTLSPQCRELLTQRFYEEKKVEEIRQHFHHNSVNVTSVAISRCLKTLKEYILRQRGG